MSRSDRAGRGRVFDVAARARLRAASTAGVYRLGDRGRWHALGAGVCVRLAGRAFVVSTGRVLSPSGPPLWLGGRRAVVPLAGAAVLADGPGAPPEIATLDAAFGFLAGDDADALAGDLEFLSLGEIDVTEGAGDDAYYAVPAPSLADGGDAQVPPMSADYVRLRQAPSGDYRRHGVEYDTHLVLRPDGDAGAPWAPERLRGCGIWRASRAAARDPLAGIVIDGGGGAQPRLVATRPCFTVLGIVGCLGAGLPTPASVRRRN